MQTKIIPNEDLIQEIGKLVQEGTDVVFKPKGMSMLPFIAGGRDSVELTRPAGLRTGDIVLAKVAGGQYVLHRLERIEGNALVLMGDGNLGGREICTAEDVVAVATKIHRGKKVVDCRSPRHRRQAKIWRHLLPLRRCLLAIYRRLN